MTETALKTREEAAIAGAALSDALGRRLHDLRISVIDRCNFRCPYCMPEEDFPAHHDFLDRSHYLSFEEIENLVRVFSGFGVRKLRITGGEPLLRRDLPDLIVRLARIQGVEDVALTTNGVLLARHARDLAEAGLGRVTVSLDSVDEDIFARMSGGRRDLQKVLDGIEAADEAGIGPIKINAVVKRGVNDLAVLSLLERFRFTPHIVRLIEYMDVGTENRWRMQDVVPAEELLAAVNQRWPVVALDSNYPGEVARRYRYADGGGEIGFISSVTRPFCGDCSRARISTDGTLYTCLFAAGGTDLKPALRAVDPGEALERLIRAKWEARTDRYSEKRVVDPGAYFPLKKVEMYRIGG